MKTATKFVADDDTEFAVDISKIKSGDKVLVEALVLNDTYFRRPGYDLIQLRFSAGIDTLDGFVIRSSIKAHTPREIKVGDEIPGSTLGCPGKSYEVLGVKDGWVWFGGKHVVELSAIRSMQAAGR